MSKIEAELGLKNYNEEILAGRDSFLGRKQEKLRR